MAADGGAGMRLAGRLAEIQPFRVMELLARARELEAAGRSIVHMEIGEPDFATPEPVTTAAQAALAEGRTHYTPAGGLPALREAIARFYHDRYGVAVAPERVVVTPGASGALLLALGVLLDPGDEVLLPDPGYPCNRHFVRFLEGRPVPVPVAAASRYQLDPEGVAAHWGERTAAVMAGSPSNPTGTVLRPEEQAALVETVHARGGTFIMDEIYHGLLYGDAVTTALAASDDVFVINSFSKYFCMTGWRLGWMVAPPAYAREAEKLAQNLFIAAPTVSQHAALAAFSPENIGMLEERRAAFQQRRDFLLPELRRLGFEVPAAPEGAFYIYADCSAFSHDSRAFCHDLLEQAGVAVTPGLDFGEHACDTHLRFAYTTSLEALEEGVRRLEGFLKQG